MRLIALSIILIELLSWLGFMVAPLGTAIFFIIILATLLVSLVDLRCGLFIFLTEIFIGSKGYLFFWENGGDVISIRIALFLVILAVWLGKTILSRLPRPVLGGARNDTFGLEPLKQARLFWPFLAVLTAIVWAFLIGLVRGNAFNNVFFDANGYFIFALAPLFFAAIKSKKDLATSLIILFSASLVSAIKTIIAFYLFTHGTIIAHFSMYKWIRDTGVGEITRLDGGFYRVFFQSHFYLLMAALIMIAMAIWPGAATALRHRVWSGVIFSALLISLSRSFAAGFIAALLALIVIAFFVFDERKKILWRSIGFAASATFLGLVITLGLFFFPYPKIDEKLSLAALDERFSFGEAAAGSRFNLLKPLWKAGLKNPFLGSGFGATVTYRTEDPRLLKQNPTGEYKTYAFEWQYLDLFLKFGIFGVLIFFWFLWRVFHLGFSALAKNKKDPALAVGLLLGLVGFLVTNIFSPYLNHPLGITYLLLAAAFFNVLNLNIRAQNPGLT